MNINGSNNPNLQVLRMKHTLGPAIGVFTSLNGREWTRVTDGPVQDSLENTIAKLTMEHAIHSPNSWMRVVDMKTGDILHDQAPQVPHEGIKDHFPLVPTEEQLRKREEWLEKVLEWCMPESYRSFLNGIPNAAKRSKVASRWLKRHKIEVQTHESGAQRVMRDGDAIAEWIV